MTVFSKPSHVLMVLALTISMFPASSWADNSKGLAKALEAQQRHTEVLLNLPGVVGTATSWTEDGTPIVKIYTEKIGIGGLPKQLDGVPVTIAVTGRIHALAPPPCKGPNAGDPGCPGSDGGDEIDPKAKFALPVPIGVSAGNMASIQPSGLLVTCNTGTLGARVSDGTKVYALSNNHVFALSNDGGANDIAAIGNPIVQPGPADANPVCSQNLASYNAIGTLSAYEPFDFTPGADNTIDAAIAEVQPGQVATTTPSDGYGIPLSDHLDCISDCLSLLGGSVQKYGRTTGHTTGTITGVHVTINVEYDKGTARFVDQIEVSADGKKGGFIRGGDSGSLLVTNPGKQPVGLLFAGDRRGKFGFANRIDLVLDHFGVTIDGQ